MNTPNSCESCGNSFLTIWIRPSQTIRKIHEHYSLKKVFGIYILMSAFITLLTSMAPAIGFPVWEVFLAGMVWAVLALPGICLMAWLLKIIANCFGSNAKTRDVLYIIYAFVLTSPAWILVGILDFIAGGELLAHTEGPLSAGIPVLAGSASMVTIILYIWAICVHFFCLNELLKFRKKYPLIRTFFSTLILSILPVGFTFAISNIPFLQGLRDQVLLQITIAPAATTNTDLPSVPVTATPSAVDKH